MSPLPAQPLAPESLASQYNTTKQAQAFLKLVDIIRDNPDGWWDNSKTKDKVIPLAKAAGFNAVVKNTLIQFNEKSGVAMKVVMVYDKTIVYAEGPSAGEVVFHTLDAAVTAIYGINDL